MGQFRHSVVDAYGCYSAAIWLFAIPLTLHFYLFRRICANKNYSCHRIFLSRTLKNTAVWGRNYSSGSGGISSVCSYKMANPHIVGYNIAMIQLPWWIPIAYFTTYDDTECKAAPKKTITPGSWNHIFVKRTLTLVYWALRRDQSLNTSGPLWSISSDWLQYLDICATSGVSCHLLWPDHFHIVWLWSAYYDDPLSNSQEMQWPWLAHLWLQTHHT